MERERKFNDRPQGARPGAFPQDIMTHAAHVKVLYPGMCSTGRRDMPKSAADCLRETGLL